MASAAPSCGCAHVVVAHWKEALNWTKKLRVPFTIMDKRAGNVGRESLSYLHYIVENYSALALAAANASHCVCFAQGSFTGAQMANMPNYGDTGLALNRAVLPGGVDVDGIHSNQMWLEGDLCGEQRGKLPPWPCFPRILGALGIEMSPGNRTLTFSGGNMIVRTSAIARVPLHTYWRLVHAHIDPEVVGCHWPKVGTPWTQVGPPFFPPPPLLPSHLTAHTAPTHRSATRPCPSSRIPWSACGASCGRAAPATSRRDARRVTGAPSRVACSQASLRAPLIL